MLDHHGSQSILRVGDRSYTIYRLDAIAKELPHAARLPFSLKILLENLLRTEDGLSVRPEDITALANWQPKAEPDKEIAFMPARVLMARTSPEFRLWLTWRPCATPCELWVVIQKRSIPFCPLSW